jgi:hypothetical protein
MNVIHLQHNNLGLAAAVTDWAAVGSHNLELAGCMSHPTLDKTTLTAFVGWIQHVVTATQAQARCETLRIAIIVPGLRFISAGLATRATW